MSTVLHCVLLGFTVAAAVVILIALVIGILYLGSYLRSVIGYVPAFFVEVFLFTAVGVTVTALITGF